jgi:hypothetical protein
MIFVGLNKYPKIMKIGVLAVYVKTSLHKKFDLILMFINSSITSYTFLWNNKIIKNN